MRMGYTYECPIIICAWVDLRPGLDLEQESAAFEEA